MISPRLILARYFAREILQTTLAVTVILLLIFLSGRFARYLADAAAGTISADIILTLLLYRAPNILERVLPLGLFLGILLVFGRMYVENEITALQAAGVSAQRLLWSSGLAIAPIAIFTGLLTFYISPASFQRVERMLNHEKQRSELELVEAGKFLPLRARRGAMYTGEIGAGRQTMNDVFIVQQHIDGEWTVLRAASGYQHYDSASDARFMTLENGTRFTFKPGEAAGERLRFTSLQQRMMPPDDFDPRKLKEDTLSTSYLLKESWRPSFMATLQWRFSLIILVPLVAMLAVAMSRTTPRQGRYIKLLPAMLLYFSYISTIDVLRRKMAEGDWPVMPGLLVAHLLFLVIALLFLYSDHISRWRRSL
ncbi:MAG TPA: LPS export ABC transporter permease LptF [Pseudomonadales bacterium]|nr:LPS export ABC transporter permease LptF [Pseudomonadales bacterium]